MAAPRRYLLTALLVLLATTLIAQNREPAPPFRAKTLGGQQFNNQSLQGKIVLLEFWTTWCPYCRQQPSLVDQITHDFADKGLMVLAVDVGESKKTVPASATSLAFSAAPAAKIPCATCCTKWA